MRSMRVIHLFGIPLTVLVGMILFIILYYGMRSAAAVPVVWVTIVLGSYQLVRETIEDVRHKRYAIDYIAILAIVVSLATGEYLVGAVIALMITSGRTLEAYGISQARASLTALIDRIPSDVTRWEDNRPQSKSSIASIKVGDFIFIRKGEVIPLDGFLESESGLTDESSITGEPYTIEKIKGDQVRSGTVNQGDAMVVCVTAVEKDSTYKKIIELVRQAQNEKAPMVRLADTYSMIFAAATIVISGITYIFSHDITRVLAVLVIATPCPLILATPIALLGGVNAAAKKRIIIKKLASIEVLARVKALIFDKTGTITLGVPRVVNFECVGKTCSNEEYLGIAEGIERNSLHPLAKAVVQYAHEKGIKSAHATEVREKIGMGIEGAVDGTTYHLTKIKDHDGMAIGLFEGATLHAVFHFEDQIKGESRQIMQNLHRAGFQLFIFTGDKKSAAEHLKKQLGMHMAIRAECTPEDKKQGIEELKRKGYVTAMVGDGINDAPALAFADVGLVFSNEEQTAASDAADVVFLGGEFSLVYDALTIARRTIKIGLTSIWWGMGLSLAGMLFAAFGLIVPIVGAVLQEAIDVFAILNALRASRQK